MSTTKKYYYTTTQGAGGGAYFLGFIGAAVYYIQTAPDFWGGAVGLLKALVWRSWSTSY